MTEAADNATRSARELARRTGVEHHDVLVVLGSGLSGVAEELGATGPSIPLSTLPFFPRPAAGQHAHGWSVTIGTATALVFVGRSHTYEGIPLHEVLHPLRTGIAAGCTTVVLTESVGAVGEDLDVGSIVAVADHLNLTGHSPVAGPAFVEMADAYGPALRAAALSGPGIGPAVSEGVYAQRPGPERETRAELRMLRALGADVVGSALAYEATAARQADAQVLGLCVVTRQAAGSATLDEATAAAAVTPAMAAMIRRVVTSIA
jgi:purine-nucleoside phosphorylase